MLLKKENLGNQPNTADFAEAHAGILASMELIHAGDVLGISQNLLDLKNTADKNGQLSKFIIKNNDIDKYEIVESTKGGIVKLMLAGKINNCGVIKPRFSVEKTGFKKFEKRYLPAKSFGLLIVSTSKGLMTHIEAQELGIGGRLIS